MYPSLQDILDKLRKYANGQKLSKYNQFSIKKVLLKRTVERR